MEVRTPASLHLPKRVPTKNAPDFPYPNKDTPKTCPVLDPNLRRRTFRGVCNTPLHVYVQNPPGFIFPHPDTPKTRPVLGPNLRRGTFRGVCNTPLHGYAQNLAGFRPKPLAKNIWGRMLLRPYTDTCKIWRVSYFHTRIHPKTHPISPFPIGIHPKPARFYTQIVAADHFGAYAFAPLHGYVKNLAGSIFPHTDAPKTHPILDPNL